MMGNHPTMEVFRYLRFKGFIFELEVLFDMKTSKRILEFGFCKKMNSSRGCNGTLFFGEREGGGGVSMQAHHLPLVPILFFFF
jgi:hypothetical protein